MMPLLRNAQSIFLSRSMRMILIKWVIALLVPLLVFHCWSGEAMLNAVLSPQIAASNIPIDILSLLQVALFVTLFYLALIIVVGYLVATDSGRYGIVRVWTDIAVFVLAPLLSIIMVKDLMIGLAVCAMIWPVYIYVRKRLHARRCNKTSFYTYKNDAIDNKAQEILKNQAVLASSCFGTVFALIWCVLDIVYYFMGSLPIQLLYWAIIRTCILPIASYGLGIVSGNMALRHILTPKLRHKESVVKLDDLPLRSAGTWRFYQIVGLAFVLCYPVLDPFLFGYGTNGRLAGYGDAGRYIILALGLNVVVGFAGLLDLGYVAFFAIGAYTWSIIGSPQLNALTGLVVNAHILSWLFWPALLVAALIAACWGIILGIPTLRLRGDYLAIVTLGFGEIVPIIFLNLDKYTNGTNGLVGVYSPAFFGIEWSTFTPAPYYYLIVLLIALTIFANVRLRDSRLGRAWLAMREDEIAAEASGINLMHTKLIAFGVGAFFSGIAGAYYAAKLGGVSPENFSFSDSVIYLAMVVIGGVGSVPSVIVGALSVYAINVLILAQLDTVAADANSILHSIYMQLLQIFPGFTFGNIRNLIFGVILVTIMVFRPQGLIPSTRRRRPEEQAEISMVEEYPVVQNMQAEQRIR